MADKKKFKYVTNVLTGTVKTQQDFEIKRLREL